MKISLYNVPAIYFCKNGLLIDKWDFIQSYKELYGLIPNQACGVILKTAIVDLDVIEFIKEGGMDMYAVFQCIDGANEEREICFKYRNIDLYQMRYELKNENEITQYELSFSAADKYEVPMEILTTLKEDSHE